MPDELPDVSTIRALATKIAAAYVRRNQVAANQIATLISTVHAALGNLGKPAVEVEAPRTPAVPIRRSVHRDYVVCLDCGLRGQMLRRHVTTAHGLTADQYRARWNLPTDHPLTALGYSERRSTMAKQIGLGRGRAAPEQASEAPASEDSSGSPSSQTRRRARPRLRERATERQ
jgi:MucR family transcriptional regulator, transcriptional regulator of exopolysaccharide biosynthesis